MNTAIAQTTSAEAEVARRTIFAGDYLNKLSGEKLEYECRRLLDQGCEEIEVNFSHTEMVNSIGISILLGIIDIAARSNARVVFTDVANDKVELFDMLGLTKHVTIA